MFDRVTKRWLQGALVCLLAVVMLGAGDPATRDSALFGRIGHNMMCVCSCGQILLECNHVGCPDSERMIGELQEQMAGPNGAGADSLILNWFVAKYGATVLAAPMRGGFDTVAWIVPITMFVLATVGTGLLVRLWSRRTQGLAGAAGLADSAGFGERPVDDDVRARIRRETDYR